jgi:2-C-methyl-D-erythritol 2,4-cyclodiphosphate synthase
MTRVGTGYDLHRLEAGRPLILAGVNIPHALGLTGHSDADIVCHAITDALLGAAALGDIGTLFPDTDPNYKDANSIELLKTAYRSVQDAGYQLGNLDCTIVTQAPKLRPHIQKMRESLANALDIPVDAVSVKAKTNEKVGPEGREEAMSAHAIVILDNA